MCGGAGRRRRLHGRACARGTRNLHPRARRNVDAELGAVAVEEVQPLAVVIRVVVRVVGGLAVVVVVVVIAAAAAAAAPRRAVNLDEQRAQHLAEGVEQHLAALRQHGVRVVAAGQDRVAPGHAAHEQPRAALREVDVLARQRARREREGALRLHVRQRAHELARDVAEERRALGQAPAHGHELRQRHHVRHVLEAEEAGRAHDEAGAAALALVQAARVGEVRAQDELAVRRVVREHLHGAAAVRARHARHGRGRGHGRAAR